MRDKIGGGVAVFVRSDFSDANEVSSFEHKHCNFLTVEIAAIKSNIICAYRPPSADLTQFLLNVDELLEKYDKVLFFADTNVDISQANSSTSRLLDTFKNNGLFLVNKVEADSHTRQDNSRGTKTYIDQYFCNACGKEEISCKTRDVPELDSDHRAIILTIELKINLISLEKTRKITYTDHKRIHEEKLILNISADPNNFQRELQNIFACHTSTKIIKNKFRKPFMTSVILKEIQLRDKYGKLKLKYPNDSKLASTFKSQRNKVSHLIEKEKKKHNEKKLAAVNHDARKTWQFLNSLLRNSDSFTSPSLKMKKEKVYD